MWQRKDGGEATCLHIYSLTGKPRRKVSGQSLDFIITKQSNAESFLLSNLYSDFIYRYSSTVELATDTEGKMSCVFYLKCH